MRQSDTLTPSAAVQRKGQAETTNAPTSNVGAFVCHASIASGSSGSAAYRAVTVSS